MTTTQLLIVCLTVLMALVVVVVAAHRITSEIGTTRRAVAREDFAARRLEIQATRDDADARERATAAPSRVGHRVTVHTKQPDDQTIFGVVTGDYKDRLVLEDAEYVTSQGGKPLPGRQDIATTDVAWVDVHDLVALPTSQPVEVKTA